MPEGLRKYSWIIIAALLIIGGTIYSQLTGGPGFTVGTDNEKILVAKGNQADFIMYSDIDEISLIDKPEFGNAIDGGTGHNTVFGTYENEKYGTYTLYLYVKPATCIEIKSAGRTMLINDTSDKRTRSLYNTIVKHTGN